jgi:hypothetical protein
MHVRNIQALFNSICARFQHKFYDLHKKGRYNLYMTVTIRFGTLFNEWCLLNEGNAADGGIALPTGSSNPHWCYG